MTLDFNSENEKTIISDSSDTTVYRTISNNDSSTINKPEIQNEINELAIQDSVNSSEYALALPESKLFKTLINGFHSNSFKRKKLQKGEFVGQYRILNNIKDGGFSSIYFVQHKYMKNYFALKTLKKNEQSLDKEVFIAEAQSLASLSHPNVIKIFDAGIIDEIPYIVLEYIDDKTLDEYIKEEKINFVQTLDILEDIGRVLSLQEEKNILHGDIKPNNIMRRKNGTYCLFDYGLANFIKQQSANNKDNIFFGTPSYMPPEQFNGIIDHRNDLFSLGITAWECLTNKKARNFRNIKSDKNKIKEIAFQPIPSIKNFSKNIPKAIERIINSLLEINPDNRYQSSNDLIQDIERFRYKNKLPHGSYNASAFIAIPYNKSYAKVYQTIEEACFLTRARPKRMDQMFTMYNIWDHIVKELELSNLIIADFTGTGWGNKKVPNPNVITEASYARAINKPLIIITQNNPYKLPVDWLNFPVIQYKNSKCGLIELKQEILFKLRKIINNLDYIKNIQ